MKNTKKKGKEDNPKRRLAPYSKMGGDQLLEVFCGDSELRKEFGSDCIETTLSAFLNFITFIRQNYENSPIQQDDVWLSLISISHESIVQEFKRLRMAGKSPAKCKEIISGKAGVKLIENKTFDPKEDLDVLQAIDEWKITVQPHIEDPGVSDVSPDAYSLTQKMVTWCDTHSSIDAGILWEVYRQITACRKPEPEGYIGHRKSPEIMKDTYRKAIDVCNRIVGLIKNGQAKREAEQRTSSDKAGDKNNSEPYSKQSLALATLKEHPDWTDKKIAKHIDVSRTTLYSWDDFKRAKKLLKQGKNDIPRGSKNSETGDIEAWDK